MRATLLGALLLVSAACGAYHFPAGGASPSPATGVVSGSAVSIPCSPVEKPGTTCGGKPVPGLELDYVDGKGGVSRTVTDRWGNYSINLQPGSYSVKVNTYMRVVSGPLKVQVDSRAYIVANYVLDSGIRAPAAQN